MLKGKKVILRPIDIEKDLDRFTRWINDPEVMKFLGKPFRPVTKEQEIEKLKIILDDETNFFFAIDELRSGKHIGSTALQKVFHFDGTAIAGMMIGDQKYWGKGYGTDALMTLLRFAFFDQNLRRINTAAIAFNKRSIRMQQKCGLKVEGIKRKEVYKNGKYHDLVMLAVFRNDWLKLWKKYSKESD